MGQVNWQKCLKRTLRQKFHGHHSFTNRSSLGAWNAATEQVSNKIEWLSAPSKIWKMLQTPIECHIWPETCVRLTLIWVFHHFSQPSCPATSARQNWADSGTLKIQVNPTHSTSRWDTLYTHCRHPTLCDLCSLLLSATEGSPFHCTMAFSSGNLCCTSNAFLRCDSLSTTMMSALESMQILAMSSGPCSA